MIDRREAITAGAALAMVGLSGIDAAEARAAKIGWTFVQASETGFRRTPVILTGKRDAILIDGGFTLSDGRELAAAIKATGKRLTTIYVSQSDPDYYFSLGPVHAAFPHVPVIAAASTVAAIKANVAGKLKTWGPQLGANGPQTLAEVVMPAASPFMSLELEGNRIEIVEAPGFPKFRYLWVPSLQAVVGGGLVIAGQHVWMADTPTVEVRRAWVTALDAITARRPKIVLPAHRTPNTPLDVSMVRYTREYILAFEQELAKARDSKALITAMIARYPNAEGRMILELGAKVATGEMTWG